MQGDAAEESVISALHAIAEREEEFDVVVIIRGGGSTSDLSLFDSYLIATHVAQFPLPIFSGIGHDKDVSVVDMVAHTSLKTPTAVATKLVEMADYEMSLVENIVCDIANLIEGRLKDESMRIYTLGTDIERHATTIINTQLNRIELIKSGLYSRIEYILSTEERRIEDAKRSLQSYSIDNILRLGFAVVRSEEGAIKSIAQTHLGQNIELELLDGSVGAEINSITPKKQ
jgi:exodeoxyribonuclease VII large subunit